ncbi:calcium-activated potassium channel subunit beta-3 [Nannospalax galili]|uniref:calcium-activated potassium channel subunit beta-3 n=1 Tax=Nannospalax galili TaxID=1026970 RepID=UPI0004ED4159|nr:calcium-activated potassium channel subunit beta-3 [Nannospalax galili]
MQPFSIPVQITLQGSQRRQGRTALPASGRRSSGAPSGGDPLPWHPKLPSSAGEDRAMLLGVTMMGSSVMMFLLLGTTILKPSELSPQREESNCTTVRTHIVDWSDSAFTCEVDCRGQGRYPCLQVLVNLTHSGHKALLHYDEEAAEANPKRDVTDCAVKDKQTLTVCDEHRQQQVRPQARPLARTAQWGRGLEFSGAVCSKHNTRNLAAVSPNCSSPYSAPDHGTEIQ